MKFGALSVAPNNKQWSLLPGWNRENRSLWLRPTYGHKIATCLIAELQAIAGNDVLKVVPTLHQ